MRPLHHRPPSPPPANGPRSGKKGDPRRLRSGGRKNDRKQQRQEWPHGRQRPLTRPVPAGAGGGAVRESPPRPRRRKSAGHGRPPLTGRPSRPGLLIPPAPRGPQPRADSPGGCLCWPWPAWPAGRSPRPDSPGGCRCWPWPTRTGASPHPFRAKRSAQPEPMGRPRPPPLTSPQQSPRRRRVFRTLRSLIGGGNCYSHSGQARASPGSLSAPADERLRS